MEDTTTQHETPLYESHCTLSEEALRKYYLYIARKSRKSRIAMAFAAIIAAAFGISQMMCGNAALAIIFFAAIPLIPLYVRLKLKKQAKKAHEMYGSLHRTEIDYRFYETHWEAVTAESWVTTEYASLQEIGETDQYFYLMQHDTAGSIVPKEECSKELMGFLRKIKLDADTAPKRRGLAILALALALTAAACHQSETNEAAAAGKIITAEFLDSMLGSDEGIPEYEAAKIESDRDTDEYKQCLARLKRLIHGNIPAKVLCDATPRSEKEWHIWYLEVECKWVEPSPDGKSKQTMFDMIGTLINQSLADSAGVMEAYMLMGEFTDGYVSEAVFDGFIWLEEQRPAKFAELRKQRTKGWNQNYDWWKEQMGD